jgi:hypothetical protein
MDGDVIPRWAVYGRAHESRSGDLHAGVAMAAFDDLLDCAQMVGTTVGRTGPLTVRFRAAHRVGRRINHEARLDPVEGRKVFRIGEARSDGLLLAEAEAIFVAPPPRPTTDVHDMHLEV